MKNNAHVRFTYRLPRLRGFLDRYVRRQVALDADLVYGSGVEAVVRRFRLYEGKISKQLADEVVPLLVQAETLAGELSRNAPHVSSSEVQRAATTGGVRAHSLAASRARERAQKSAASHQRLLELYQTISQLLTSADQELHCAAAQANVILVNYCKGAFLRQALDKQIPRVERTYFPQDFYREEIETIRRTIFSGKEA